jgi:hypothetical protein
MGQSQSYEKCATDDALSTSQKTNSPVLARNVNFTDVLKKTTHDTLNSERIALKTFFEDKELFFDMEKFIVFFCEGCLNRAKSGSSVYGVSLGFKHKEDRTADLEMLNKMGLNDYIITWKELCEKLKL